MARKGDWARYCGVPLPGILVLTSACSPVFKFYCYTRPSDLNLSSSSPSGCLCSLVSDDAKPRGLLGDCEIHTNPINPSRGAGKWRELDEGLGLRLALPPWEIARVQFLLLAWAIHTDLIGLEEEDICISPAELNDCVCTNSGCRPMLPFPVAGWVSLFSWASKYQHAARASQSTNASTPARALSRRLCTSRFRGNPNYMYIYMYSCEDCLMFVLYKYI